MSTTELIMRLVAGVLFAGLGYVVSRKIPRESKIAAWVVFALGALLASDILRHVSIIAIDDYSFYLSSSLYGFGVGVLAGFIGKKGPQIASNQKPQES